MCEDPTLKEVSTMSLQEFRDFGFLQELNRKFLHPMGLAIGFACDYDEESDKFIPNGDITIQDYREDPDGFRYADSMLWGEETKAKAERVAEFQKEKHFERLEELGYVVQPLLNGGEEKLTQFIDQNLKFIQEEWDAMDFRWIKQADAWGCMLWDQDAGELYSGQGETIELAYYDADPRTVTGKDAKENLKRVLKNMDEDDS